MKTTHTRLAKDGSLKVFFCSALALMMIQHLGDIASLVEGLPFIEDIAGHGLVVGIALFPSGIAYTIIWITSWLLRNR
jgi:hypothetical protein